MPQRHRTTLYVAALVAFALLPGTAAADICVQKYKEGRAVHAELQRKAIEELNAKDYPAACKTMRELARLSLAMRAFSERNCWRNEDAKRMHASADRIADRAKEICAQAEKR